MDTSAALWFLNLSQISLQFDRYFGVVARSVMGHSVLDSWPGGVEIAVALGVTAAYLLVFLRMAGPEERSHMIEYGVVGVFIFEALAERASQGRRVPALPLLAVLATAALGLLDECIQVFLPSRVFDPQDILFNLLAGTMAVGASVALAWARRWTRSRRESSGGAGGAPVS